MRARHDHLAAFLGELDGVGEEVEQDLLEPPRIGDDGRQIWCERGPEHDARALGERLQAAGAILDDLGHVDRGEIELELAGLDLGDVEQVVEKRERVEAALMDVLDIAFVALVADRAEPLLQHQLGEADDRVERRAHLVADLGEEVDAPGRGVGLELGRVLGRGRRLRR